MPCHCLLVEAGQGLVLVDTGFGEQDVRDARGRLGGLFTSLARPVRDLQETAVRQVARLGFSADDVRYIVTTHLDLDHAGGLGDFPQAEVFLMQDELEAATRPSTSRERSRYRQAHWSHGVHWQPQQPGQGERWFGLEGVRRIPGLRAEILLVPLPGHTRGHCGVAIRHGQGWILHVGDAFMVQEELVTGGSWGLRLYHRTVDGSLKQSLSCRGRLRALAHSHGDLIRLVCSHDMLGFLDLA